MESFENINNSGIVLNLVKAIQENKEYLSEVDGLIGDGDHGINMNKGFTLAGQRITPDQSFSSALKILGDTLLMEIGGSMGPIYGTFFRKSASSVKALDSIDKLAFGKMLQKALDGIKEIGDARVGDKTLIDTLEPAVTAFNASCEAGKSFSEAIDAADEAALKGKDSTKDMIARIGRASRLGERSRGVLDAGATSCYIILHDMFNSVRALI